MQPVKIFLTRHGQTPLNAKGCMQGRIDTELTQEGIKQAKDLANRLKNEKFDCIYTSPLKRAHATAKEVALFHECPFESDDRLMEMGFGTWEGRSIDDIKASGSQRAHDFWKSPENYTPEDGENFLDVRKRIDSFFRDILKKCGGQAILIVCHGMLIRNILSYVKGEDFSKLWTHPRIYHTGLTVFSYDEKTVDFEMISDISHMSL